VWREGRGGGEGVRDAGKESWEQGGKGMRDQGGGWTMGKRGRREEEWHNWEARKKGEGHGGESERGRLKGKGDDGPSFRGFVACR
jgi:hypothetical protein